MPPYKRGLISKDQFQETTVSDEELDRVAAIFNGTEIPLTGFENHLLKVQSGQSRPLCPKEKAIMLAWEKRHWNYEDDLLADGASNELTAEEQATRNEIYSEYWSDTDDYARSDEDGWLYED